MNTGVDHYHATYLEPHAVAFGEAAVAWVKWQLKADKLI